MRPKKGRTAPCRAGKTEIKYCRLMKATLLEERSVQTAIQWRTSSIFVVYVQRKRKDPYFVWNHCPYCGKSLVPKAARKAMEIAETDMVNAEGV